MNITMLGAQGSGKGTQATIISERRGLLHISMGDLLREIAESGTELGETIKEFLHAGSLVPDDVVVDMIKQRIDQPDAEKGVILDGFPRTLAQAKALDPFFPVDVVLSIEISDALAIQRLSGRVQCKQCREVYGVENPPLEEGICDKCYGQLYHRDDDRPDAIAKRLEQFHKEIKPLLAHYREKLHRVNGEATIEEIAEEINVILDSMEKTE